ncbi:MAG: hypothetical protein AB1726_06650 [Planctomycetota bacterium]
MRSLSLALTIPCGALQGAPGRRRAGLGLAAAAVLALGGSGCASYTARTAGALHDFQRGHLAAAQAAYGDTELGGSEFLAGAEAGMVALAAGDWDGAQASLERAAAAAADIEERALLGPERFGELLGSWVLNDTMRAYQGEGFERVYVHAGLAMAYLARGRLDDVYVEARRANQLLEAEEKLYETSYHAGGLGHFVSALAYELLGDWDDATIDYQRMVEKGVGEELAGRALVRLAGRLGRADELALWVERFGPDLELPAGAASVVVLAGVGLAPFKVEGSLVVPTPDGLIPFAVPIYERRPQPVAALELVETTSGVGVRTEVLESVADVAVENLEDRVAWMAAKSVARGILKRELTKEAQKKHGLAGRIAGDLFAAISERADLRAWLTLPDSWQAARLFVPPGACTYILEARGGSSRPLGTFELEPGETLVVLARSVGTDLYAHVIGGRPVEPLPAAPAAEGAALEVHQQ